jgi:UDP-N-acetylglucosamine 2-epimerase
MRVLSVVGNRPQFVKSAPLSVALRERGLEEVVVHTGQHYDRQMSDIFFEELGIGRPAYRLNVRSARRDLLLGPIAAAVRAERPDLVLVYGDTNSTAAGAKAATAGDVPVAHVEAGLRSGDLAMPEERNRIEVDHASSLLLCPDERSAATLRAEGVRGRIEVVGDVMADAARIFVPIARERVPVARAPGSYVVATVHREANVEPTRLRRIVEGLGRIAEPVVFPAHPRTRRVLDEAGLGVAAQVEVIEPLGYLELAALASQARVILTDSGGLQKEAYWYGVPCVTLRPSTEWVDTVLHGANVLVDDDPEAIADAVRTATMPAERPVLYGDGHASELIASVLIEFTRELAA